MISPPRDPYSPAPGSSDRYVIAASGAGQSEYRADIDGLRAVAILLVVAFHAGLPFVPAGFLGVDVFFVISGFLITSLLLDELLRSGTISLTKFYARRIRRLLPASAVVLAGVTLASWIFIAPLDHPRIASDVLSAGLYYANWHFAGQATDYFAPDVTLSPVLHYWSLAVEEQFYLIWPLLLVALVGRKSLAKYLPTVTARRVGVVLLSVGLVSLVLSLWVSTPEGHGYYGLHTRAWELAAGGGLAVARPYLPRLPSIVAAPLGWIGLAVIAGAAVFSSPLAGHPGVAAMAPVLGTVAVLVSGAQPRQRIFASLGPASLLCRGSLRYIGRRSYSWYLWHWPVLVLSGVGIGQSAAGGDVSPWVIVLCVAGSFALADLTYRYVETPTRRSFWLADMHMRPMALGLGLTAVSAAGAVLLALHTPTSIGSFEPAISWRDAKVERTLSPAELPAGQWPEAQMSPVQARNDRVETMGPCALSFADTRVASPCVFGSPRATKRIALVGDSHAQHWLPAVRAIAQKRGWQVYAWMKSSCAVADVDLYISTYARSYTECDQWRANLEQRLRGMPHLDVLLIARSQGHAPRLLAPSGALATPEERGPLWRAGTERMLDKFAGVADRVVLMTDTPWVSDGENEPNRMEDVPYCLSASNAKKCAFPAERHVRLDAALVQAEEAAIATRPRVAHVDPTPLVCPGTVCPVVSRTGVIMYADSHHLTSTFSRSLGPALERLLLPVLSPAAVG